MTYQASWEHQYGVKKGTLDNPGWRVKIDLNENKSRQQTARPNDGSPFGKRLVSLPGRGTPVPYCALRSSESLTRP